MLVKKINTFFKNSIRFILAAILCFSSVTSFVLPAAANAPSSVTKGEANLNKIQEQTDDVAQSQPLDIKGIQEAQEGGLNEAQGKKDIEKMISPEDAQGTTTLKDRLFQALDRGSDSK
jgi:hypothetical protein